MKITVKCPNCNQQVESDSAFCTFCGVSVTGAADGSEITHDPAATAAPAPEIETSFIYCPNGHAVLNPSLGFCSDCGAVLVDHVEHATVAAVSHKDEEAPEPVYRPTLPRSCFNGHVHDDPELDFCPECGLALAVASARVDERWKCACGHSNSFDDSFCEKCGTPRNVARKSSDEFEASAAKPIAIPDGMYAPTNDDLRKK